MDVMFMEDGMFMYEPNYEFWRQDNDAEWWTLTTAIIEALGPLGKIATYHNFIQLLNNDYDNRAH